MANSGSTGYFRRNNELEAVDLTTGRALWTSPNYLERVGASQKYVFVESQPTLNGYSLIALSRRNGAREFSLEESNLGSVVDGVLYAKSGNYAYVTYDALTLHPLWRTLGGGDALTGAPVVKGNVLLQSFENDGAILEGVMYAFNVANGDNLWSHLSAGSPIGYVTGAVYLNSTWFPMQLDNYIPLTVDRVSLATGKTLDSYTYKPDPERNAANFRSFDNAQTHPLVAGGYVYLTVSGMWYRYSADTQPSQAHSVRLERVEVLGAFDDGNVLLSARDGVSVAQSLPDRLELHRVTTATLRSKIVKRADGSRYAVIGDALYSFGRSGSPRALGKVACGDIGTILFWSSRVAVRCKGTNHLLIFRDSRLPIIDHARPMPATTPKFTVAIHTIEIPRAKNFIKQWRVGAIAALPSGGFVFTLGSGALNFQSAIGRYSGGHVVVTVLPGGSAPVRPSSIVADARGRVFFNDDHHAAVMELQRSGKVISVVGNVPSPSPTTSASWMHVPRPVPGFRLAIGPDGQAWFARSHPRREIARVDGSRTFEIPSGWGDALVLKGGSDGALWFLTQTLVGRMTTTGQFTREPLPISALHWRGYPYVGMTVGKSGSAWLSVGPRLVEMNAHRVLREVILPNASTGVRAMAVGCHGTLYAAETVPQIARITQKGKVEEYPLTLAEIDGLVRAPDCSIWFMAGTNAQRQQIGKLQFIPRR